MMIDEMVVVGLKFDVIVFVVGGGGLLCGVLEGLVCNGWYDVFVVVVEMVGVDCYVCLVV